MLSKQEPLELSPRVGMFINGSSLEKTVKGIDCLIVRRGTTEMWQVYFPKHRKGSDTAIFP